MQSPKQDEPTEAHTRHIIIKMAKIKDKERILKAAREKQLLTRELPQDWFLTRNISGQKVWLQMFQVMKSRDLQPRWLYPAQLSFRIKEQIKSFPDKKKLKELIASKPLLYEMLKDVQQLEKKIKKMTNKR